MQLSAFRELQVVRRQTDLLANFELQLAMVGIKVPFLVLLSLLELLLGLSHHVLHLRGNLISPHMLPSTHKNINRQAWELPKGPQRWWCASALCIGRIQP